VDTQDNSNYQAPSLGDLAAPLPSPNPNVADDAALKDAADGGAVPEEKVAAAPTCEQTREIFIEHAVGQPRPPGQIDLANETYNETADKLNNMPNEDWGKSESGRRFLESFQRAMFTIPYDSWYSEITYRPGSYWVQDVPSENGPLFATKRSWQSGDGKKLTGEAAMMRVRQALGQGTTFTIPLYHTGIWVTMKAPSDEELVELNRKLTEEKVNLGRQTHGMIFGNNSAIFAGVLADFAIEHIYNSNLIEHERSYHEVISVLDLPLLIWGLAYTVWPQGYPYSRVKINDNGEYITEEAILKLGSCQITDNLAITDRQRAHMAKQRGQKVNRETLRIYQEQFLRGQERRVVVNDQLSFVLSVPSIAEYLENGARWVNNITAMVDKALGLNTDERQRVAYIQRLGKATNLRQFSHWVKQINVGADILDEREDIDNALDVYSSADQYSEVFFDAIKQYVEDSTVSVVAVPRGDYENPSTVMKKFPNFMVLDTMSTFFILLLQKVQLLDQRK